MTNRAGLLLGLLLLLPCEALAATITGGPLVGATDDTTTRIWVRADGPCKVTVTCAAGEARVRGEAATRADLDHTADVALAGLTASTTYTYEVQVDGQPLAGGPWRFTTPPRAGTGRVSLAFGSCVHMGRFPVQPIFDVIADARPTAFVFVGDNSYYANEECDDPAKMWARYRAQRQNASMRRLIGNTPILATWDDHDYGPNNSDRTFPRKADARRIFMGYWPMPAYGEQDEGIYSVAHVGPIDVVLCDDRFFRDPEDSPRSPESTMLGARQRRWLVETLTASTAPIKVVAVGSQVLATDHPFEGMQDMPDERQEIIDAIRERKIPGVIFISGDRHLCEVTRWTADRAGYTLWDITSSPLANRTFREGGGLPNRDRVYLNGDTNNFGWIEVDADKRTVKLELRDEQGKTLWSVEPTDLFPGKRYFK